MRSGRTDHNSFEISGSLALDRPTSDHELDRLALRVRHRDRRIMEAIDEFCSLDNEDLEAVGMGRGDAADDSMISNPEMRSASELFERSWE